MLYVKWTMKVSTRQYNVTCYIAGMCSGLTHSFRDEVDAEISSSRHPACEVVCGVVTDHDPYCEIKNHENLLGLLKIFHPRNFLLFSSKNLCMKLKLSGQHLGKGSPTKDLL